MDPQRPVDTMLDDPGHSRQWVLRRLQRALTLDRNGAALRAGLAAGVAPADAAPLRGYRDASGERAGILTCLIDELGSAPYASLGLSTVLSRLVGRILAITGHRVWLPLLRRLAHHTLAEYDQLVAFAENAPGAPANLIDALRPLLAGSRAEVEWLDGRA